MLHVVEKMSARFCAWSVERISALIDLYEAHPCLYNTKSKDYHDRDCRVKAIAEIATALEVTGTSLHAYMYSTAMC